MRNARNTVHTLCDSVLSMIRDEWKRLLMVRLVQSQAIVTYNLNRRNQMNSLYIYFSVRRLPYFNQ